MRWCFLSGEVALIAGHDSQTSMIEDEAERWVTLVDASKYRDRPKSRWNINMP